MSGHEQDFDVEDSTPNANGPDRAEGGMGVSSERIGPTGPGQTSSNGTRDTSPVDDAEGVGHDATVPPEQRPGAVEENPADVDPKVEPPSLNPRSSS